MHESLDTSSTTALGQPVNVIWNVVLPAPDELRSARRRLHLKAVTILVLLVASYYGAGHFGVRARDPVGCGGGPGAGTDRRRDEHHARRQPRLVLAPPVDQRDPRLHVRRARGQLLAVADPTQRPAPRQHQRRRLRRRSRAGTVGAAGALPAVASSVPLAARVHLAAVWVPLHQEPVGQRRGNARPSADRQAAAAPAGEPRRGGGQSCSASWRIWAGRWWSRSCSTRGGEWSPSTPSARGASGSGSRSSSSWRTASTSPSDPTPTRPVAATTSPCTSCAPPSTSRRRCRSSVTCSAGLQAVSTIRSSITSRPAPAYGLPDGRRPVPRRVRRARDRVPGPPRNLAGAVLAHAVAAGDGTRPLASQ